MGTTSWRERVELIAEIGIRGTAAGEMVWDVSAWDSSTATWSGLEPDWQPLAGSELERFESDRGRSQGLGRNSAGTSSLGLVWRDARGGKWSFREGSPVRVGWELRVRASVDGRGSIPIYRGTVRRVRDQWARTTFRLGLELVDRLADLGAVDLPEQPAAAGLDDLTHARVLRVLDLAGINRGYALMGTGFDDSGVVHHASSTFARNLLDEAYTSVESEAGADLLVDRDGLLTLRRASWWQAIEGHAPNPRWNATRATWANVERPGPYVFEVLEPGGFGTGSDLDDVRNQVSAARTGGTAIVVEDASSKLLYGVRTYQRFDLTCRYDADVSAFAELYLSQLSTRTARVDALEAELDPRLSSDELERWIDVELGDQHAIEWSDGDGLETGTFHVHGIRHRIDPGHWRLGLDLWAFEGGLAPESAWGSAVWGTSQWR